MKWKWLWPVTLLNQGHLTHSVLAAASLLCLSALFSHVYLSAVSLPPASSLENCNTQRTNTTKGTHALALMLSPTRESGSTFSSRLHISPAFVFVQFCLCLWGRKMLASPMDENKCKNPDLKRPLGLQPGPSRQWKIWILSNHDLQGRKHANGPGDARLPCSTRPHHSSTHAWSPGRPAPGGVPQPEACKRRGNSDATHGTQLGERGMNSMFP